MTIKYFKSLPNNTMILITIRQEEADDQELRKYDGRIVKKGSFTISPYSTRIEFKAHSFYPDELSLGAEESSKEFNKRCLSLVK